MAQNAEEVQAQQGQERSPQSHDGNETPDGFLVGTDPKAPVRTAAEWSQPETAVGNSRQVQLTEPQAPAQFTAEDIERARQEEKEKLYGRISQMDDRLKSFESERAEREAAEQQAVEEAEARRKAEEEETMKLRDLLERRESEWNERFDRIESERQQERAIAEKESRLRELEGYARDRVAQESEYIMPELRDLIGGNNEDEIERAIGEMKDRTASIMQSAGAAQQLQRQDMRGTAPTAPPVGPLEQQPATDQLSAQDIESMDMDTYRKNRSALMQAANNAYQRG